MVFTKQLDKLIILSIFQLTIFWDINIFIFVHFRTITNEYIKNKQVFKYNKLSIFKQIVILNYILD